MLGLVGITTRLEFEHVLYQKMCIANVNSYIAVTQSGKVKRIGAYAYERASENPGTRELPWHKDHSAVVIAKAAERLWSETRIFVGLS